MSLFGGILFGRQIVRQITAKDAEKAPQPLPDDDDDDDDDDADYMYGPEDEALDEHLLNDGHDIFDHPDDADDGVEDEDDL